MLKNYNKKIILASILLLSLAVLAPSNSAFAQTTTSTTVQLQELINKLLAQVSALQEQMAKVKTQQQEVAQTISEITATLKEGDKGANVKTLQALLAADSTIYPEGLITGFYGPLTTKAVKKFQERHGLKKVGFIGPKTKLKLNELLKNYPLAFEKIEKKIEKVIEKIDKKQNNDDDDEDNDDDDEDNDDENNDNEKIFKTGRLCAIVPPGHLIAPGWLKKYEDDDRSIIPLCQILPYGIAKKLGQATSTPDITAPIISAISTNDTTSTATIIWITNEGAKSQIDYGLISSYGSSTAIDSTLKTNHSRTIDGLLPATVYHFQIKVQDLAGNIATSSDQTFTTNSLPIADTTAPVISGIAVSASSTSANVAWTTNEAATSKAYYSTVSPLDISSTSTLSASNSTLFTSHSLNLTGLTASSTYYFAVESKDAANNIATSTEQLFTTSQ
ncbi:MAG: fibronectin type III domain-containing protein [Patescibacteria group bacterium]